MPRRRAFLHIGLPGTGGTFLGAELARHAEDLRAQGVCAPARSAEEMFRAALEMRRDHKAWGLRRRDVEGAWVGICRRAHKSTGTVVVGHELLAACTPEQIALLLDGLAGFEVHVVVTARDPATQVVSGWVDSVGSGSAATFTRFLRRVLDPDREHPRARAFWTGQALDEVLDRWSAAMRDPHRLHVVALPAETADPRPEIWQALGRLAGFDAAALPLVGDVRSPLGADTSTVRDLNDALDGRLAPGEHRDLVGEFLPVGDGHVARRVVPEEAYDDLLELAERWTKRIADAGYDVLGDPDDLLPEPPFPGPTLPIDPTPEERLARTTDALADALVEVARLREHAAALEVRNETLRKKRRRLKQRLADATAP